MDKEANSRGAGLGRALLKGLLANLANPFVAGVAGGVGGGVAAPIAVRLERAARAREKERREREERKKKKKRKKGKSMKKTGAAKGKSFLRRAGHLGAAAGVGALGLHGIQQFLKKHREKKERERRYDLLKRLYSAASEMPKAASDTSEGPMSGIFKSAGKGSAIKAKIEAARRDPSTKENPKDTGPPGSGLADPRVKRQQMLMKLRGHRKTASDIITDGFLSELAAHDLLKSAAGPKWRSPASLVEEHGRKRGYVAGPGGTVREVSRKKAGRLAIQQVLAGAAQKAAPTGKEAVASAVDVDTITGAFLSELADLELVDKEAMKRWQKGLAGLGILGSLFGGGALGTRAATKVPMPPGVTRKAPPPAKKPMAEQMLARGRKGEWEPTGRWGERRITWPPTKEEIEAAKAIATKPRPGGPQEQIGRAEESKRALEALKPITEIRRSWLRRLLGGGTKD